MGTARLSALDASFLEIESSAAHMHVGWACVFDPPRDGPPPSFEQLRDHIRRRLGRAPRYRQRLAPVPLGVARPVWVDDERFDIAHHVKKSRTGDLTELADAVMSTPLSRERPLWELWVADRLGDGRIGLVGKAHHCMVDGIAAVELGTLLLDPTPRPKRERADRWAPEPSPSPARRLVDGVSDRLREGATLATLPARLAASPGRLLEAPSGVERTVRALARSFAPARPARAINEPLSPYRHLATHARPLDELRRVKRAFGTTVNDVVLAVSAAAVRGFLEERELRCPRLKAMVPVNVRDEGGEDQLGNRISFMFLELPCDEPDPVRRLLDVHLATRECKEAGEPEGADAVLKAVAYVPSTLQRVVSHLVASPRTFNLVVSNIPGPREPLYMLGCRLREAYPVVPLADRHSLSIGFTNVADGAFFGVYADRDALPDADRLADRLGQALDELLERAGEREPALARA